MNGYRRNMPEEVASATQPYPTVLPPYNRQTITADDINPYLPVSQQGNWKKRLAAGRSGLFEPLSDQYETFTMPGANGGTLHGNTAANPAKGIVYITTQDKPSVYRLKKDVPAALKVPITGD